MKTDDFEDRIPPAASLVRLRGWAPQISGKHVPAELILKRAEAMVTALRARAPEGDALRRLPDATIEDAIEAEFFKARVPHARGGFQLGYDVLVDMVRTLARGDVSAAWVIGFLTMHAGWLSRFPKEGQDEAFGDKPYALTACTFRPTPGGKAVPGGFRVSGRWDFTTGVRHTDWVIVSSLVDMGDGLVQHMALVPLSEVTILDTWDTHGARGTGSDDVVLEDVFVPSARMVPTSVLWGANSPGASAFPGYEDLRLPMRNAPPVMLAALAVGGAEGALDIYREYVKKRVLFGNVSAVDQPYIKSRYMRAATLVRMAGQLIDGQLLEYRFCSEHAERQPSMEDRGRRAAEAAMCAVLARDAVTDLMDIAGAGSYRLSNGLQQVRRDVDMAKAHLQSDWDAMSEMGGHLMLGLEPRSRDNLILLGI